MFCTFPPYWVQQSPSGVSQTTDIQAFSGASYVFLSHKNCLTGEKKKVSCGVIDVHALPVICLFMTIGEGWKTDRPVNLSSPQRSSAAPAQALPRTTPFTKSKDAMLRAPKSGVLRQWQHPQRKCLLPRMQTHPSLCSNRERIACNNGPGAPYSCSISHWSTRS